VTFESIVEEDDVPVVWHTIDCAESLMGY
jgi:hypothetical protein